MPTIIPGSDIGAPEGAPPSSLVLDRGPLPAIQLDAEHTPTLGVGHDLNDRASHAALRGRDRITYLNNHVTSSDKTDSIRTD